MRGGARSEAVGLDMGNKEIAVFHLQGVQRSKDKKRFHKRSTEDAIVIVRLG